MKRLLTLLLAFLPASPSFSQMDPKPGIGAEYNYRSISGHGVSSFGGNLFVTFMAREEWDVFCQAGLSASYLKPRTSTDQRFMAYSLTGNFVFIRKLIGPSLRYHVYDNISVGKPLSFANFDAGVTLLSFVSIYYSYTGNENLFFANGGHHGFTICVNLNTSLLSYAFQSM